MNYQLLINKNHPICEETIHKIDLVPIVERNMVFYLERKVRKKYLKLKKKVFHKTGIIIAIDSGYRSIEEQKEILSEIQKEYGIEYARKYVSQPYKSEHHTGLAIDLTLNINGYYLENNHELEKHITEFKQIYKFLPYFGFILRYPKGKENMTEISFEPWHIRYVGVKTAKYLKKNNQVLEQYKKKYLL